MSQPVADIQRIAWTDWDSDTPVDLDLPDKYDHWHVLYQEQVRERLLEERDRFVFEQSLTHRNKPGGGFDVRAHVPIIAYECYDEPPESAPVWYSLTDQNVYVDLPPAAPVDDDAPDCLGRRQLTHREKGERSDLRLTVPVEIFRVYQDPPQTASVWYLSRERVLVYDLPEPEV